MLPVVLVFRAALTLAQDPPPAAPPPAAEPAASEAPAPPASPPPGPPPPAVNLVSVTSSIPVDAAGQSRLEAPFRAAVPGLELCYTAQRERASESVGDLLAQTSYGKKGELLTLSVLTAGVLDDELRGCANAALKAALGDAATGPKKAQVSISYELRQPKP